MELQLTPDIEAKLNDLALRTHRELLREAVDHLVTYTDWFEHKVRASVAAVERGEIVSNEEVLSLIDRRERS